MIGSASGACGHRSGGEALIDVRVLLDRSKFGTPPKFGFVTQWKHEILGFSLASQQFELSQSLKLSGKH
jgi:hypothetical protein